MVGTSGTGSVDDSSVVLGDSELAELAAFGDERVVAVGDVLFRVGDSSYDFIVVLEGEVEVTRDQDGSEVVVAVHGAGRFLGELNLLTGQRLLGTARVTQPGRVLAIPPGEFRRLMSTMPDLADTIFRALVARREELRSGESAAAVRIIGSQFSPETMALRAFAARSRLVHSFIDVEGADDIEALLASMELRPADMPVVITPNGVLRRPSPGEFAEHLGLTFRPSPDHVFDLVVVGSGPAGLAAAVAGASEGLSTVSVDAVAIGGQAGTSSRIENYVGFPNGISGEELTSRAATQAQRLGARLNAPCEAAGLRLEDGLHAVVLVDGSEIPSRTVVVASGARYRRLAVEDLERFEGSGVYYAATDLEARMCDGSDVLVVGGGNSAGQAAIHLAQNGSRVSIAIRGNDLASSMSRYLIERIDAHPDIRIMTRTEVRGLAGEHRLERAVLENTSTGQYQEVECTGLFCFIGAVPATAWLNGAVSLDDHGFILTDRSLPPSVATGASFAARDPLPFETSVPGIFAAGDVRHGSVKRVAAAVGEGSSVVRSALEYASRET